MNHRLSHRRPRTCRKPPRWSRLSLKKVDLHAAHSSDALEFVTRRCMRMLQDIQVGQSIKSLEIDLCQCLNCYSLFIFLFLFLFLCICCHSAQFGHDDHQHIEEIPVSGIYFCIFCLTGNVPCHRLFFFSLPCCFRKHQGSEIILQFLFSS